MIAALWIGMVARAEGPEPPASDDDVRQRLTQLEAELADVKAQLAQAAQDALLRDAEALAASAPVPPPPPPASSSTFNPGITAFGDAFATVGVRDGEILPQSRPWIRSLELDIRAAIDPFSRAVAVLAVEQEPPDFSPGAPLTPGATFSAAPEELYVDFIALPAGLSLRAGGFRQPFGITNRAHAHDFPWPDLPLALASILGEEGLNDVGGVVTWHVPNPWDKGITLEGGANAGDRFDPDGRTALPAWIARAEYFDRLGKLEVGLGGSATGGVGTADRIVGADLLARWRANSWRSVVLLVEVLSTSGADRPSTGGYAALQVQPTRPLYLGLRADRLDDQWQAGGFVSYYTSEFLRLRAGGMLAADGLVTSNLQLTFVWGSHPVEPYWVNR